MSITNFRITNQVPAVCFVLATSVMTSASSLAKSSVHYQQTFDIDIRGDDTRLDQVSFTQRGLAWHHKQYYAHHVICGPQQCLWKELAVHRRQVPYRFVAGYQHSWSRHILSSAHPFLGFSIQHAYGEAADQQHFVDGSWLGKMTTKNGLTAMPSTATLPHGPYGLSTHLSTGGLASSKYDTQYVATRTYRPAAHKHRRYHQSAHFDKHTQRYRSTRLFVGYPTTRSTDYFALPTTMHSSPHAVFACSHHHSGHFGISQSAIDYREQKLSLSLHHRVPLEAITIAPAILWKTSPAVNPTQPMIAYGGQLQGPLNHVGVWQFAYAKCPSHACRLQPWTAQSHLHWLLGDWTVLFSTHHNAQRKNTLQSKVKYQHSDHVLMRTVTFQSRWHNHGDHQMSLALALRHRLDPIAYWQAEVRNDQYNIRYLAKPRPHASSHASLIVRDKQTPLLYDLSIEQKWRDHFAYWHYKTHISNSKKAHQWTLHASSGVLCGVDYLIWTPLRRMDAPYQVVFNSEIPRRHFYHGTRPYLMRQGCQLR